MHYLHAVGDKCSFKNSTSFVKPCPAMLCRSFLLSLHFVLAAQFNAQRGSTEFASCAQMASKSCMLLLLMRLCQHGRSVSCLTCDVTA